VLVVVVTVRFFWDAHAALVVTLHQALASWARLDWTELVAVDLVVHALAHLTSVHPLVVGRWFVEVSFVEDAVGLFRGGGDDCWFGGSWCGHGGRGHVDVGGSAVAALAWLVDQDFLFDFAVILSQSA